MLIGCDGTPLFRREDGVGRYSSQIWRALVAECPETSFEVIGFRDDRRQPRLVDPESRVEFQWLPIPRRLASLMYRLSGGPSLRFLLKRTPDFMYYPNFVRFPRLDGIPFAVVVHDLAHVDVPATVEGKNRQYLTRRLPESVRKATLVITPSRFVANSVRASFPQWEGAIAVVQPGVEQVFKPSLGGEISRVSKKYSLPKDYVLFVGSLQPRKNIDLLLSAYERLPERLRNEHSLVLAGASGWKNSKTAERIQRMQAVGMSLILPGFIEDSDLPALYCGARVFVFPSLYEGFGIPPLEAMACGTPVISTCETALSEVVGTAAATISGSDPEELARTLISVLSDAKRRTDMVEAGFEHAKQFSWQKSAQSMVAALEKAGFRIRSAH